MLMVRCYTEKIWVQDTVGLLQYNGTLKNPSIGHEGLYDLNNSSNNDAYWLKVKQETAKSFLVCV